MADSKKQDQANVRSAEREYEAAKKQSSDRKKKAAVAGAAVVATVATAGAAAPAAGAAAGGTAAGGAAAGTGAAAGSATAGTAAAGAEAGAATAGSEAAASGASSQAANAAQKGQEAANKFRDFEEKAKKVKDNYDKIKDKVDKVEELKGDEDEEGEDEEDEEGEGEVQYSGTGTASAKKKRRLPTIIAILVIGALTPLLLLTAAVLYPVHLLVTTGDQIVSFFETIFEKAKNAFCELLGIGTVPDETADTLAQYGIEVGAVTGTGEFVQTNRVIASGPEYVIAASDGSTVEVASGELSVRFKGKVISASNFQSELDSDPEFFNAFYNAVDRISDTYDETSEYSAKSAAYEDLGLKKNPYAGYYDAEKDENVSDQERFAAYFANLIDGEGSTTVVGTEYIVETEEGSSVAGGEYSAAAYAQAQEYIRDTTKDISEDSVIKATEKAGALLNSAISANEPYYAARAYSAVLEAVDLNAPNRSEALPVNEVMNVLTEETTSKTINPETGESVTVTGSAALSPNLNAVTHGDEYDKDVAAGYSRDRAMNLTSYYATTKYSDTDCVKLGTMHETTKETVVSIGGFFEQIWSWLVSIFGGKHKPDESVLLDATEDSITGALFTQPSSAMVGETLGERFVQGAAYYNVVQAREVGAATVSDDTAVAAYTDMTTKVLAQKEAAERATKSPFDASSPYTFLGSIVNSLQPIFAQSGSVASKISAVGKLTSKSIAKITTGAYADNAEDIYQRNYGDCTTENAVGGEGDMFCNENPTFDPTTFSMTLKDFETKLADNFESDGKIKGNSALADYAINQTERKSTPGVRDAEVCANKGNSKCEGDEYDESVKSALGKKYANTNENAAWNTDLKYQQGYFLEVYVLDMFGYYSGHCLGATENPIVAYKTKYYQENPRDNSYLGRLALRTGMSKDDIIAGIEAINLLAYLHNYDPSTRLAFGADQKPQQIYFEATQPAVIANTFADERKKIIYSDRRNCVQKSLMV